MDEMKDKDTNELLGENRNKWIRICLKIYVIVLPNLINWGIESDRDPNDGVYDVLIGKGLFSTLTYRKHHKIAEFVGEVIGGNELFEFLKTNDGIKRVAYAHPLSEDYSYYLDCVQINCVHYSLPTQSQTLPILITTYVDPQPFALMSFEFFIIVSIWHQSF